MVPRAPAKRTIADSSHHGRGHDHFFHFAHGGGERFEDRLLAAGVVTITCTGVHSINRSRGGNAALRPGGKRSVRPRRCIGYRCARASLASSTWRGVAKSGSPPQSEMMSAGLAHDGGRSSPGAGCGDPPQRRA